MTVLEKAEEIKTHSNYNSNNDIGLVVDPMDITFDDLTSDTVMIRVRIRNEGDHCSSPTYVRLESALFGAFVPWRPLATLPVPVLEPGESRVLSVLATRPHPMPLGDFDRVPPMDVIKALGASPDESSPPPGAGPGGQLNLIRRQGLDHVTETTVDLNRSQGTFEPVGKKMLDLVRMKTMMDQSRSKSMQGLLRRLAAFRHATKTKPDQIPSQGTPPPAMVLGRPTLPPDLWELMGRKQPHWAGNINVFVGNRAVERHKAKALRIYSGRPNMAMFVVGDPGKCDAYAFNLVGVPSDWKAALYNGTSAKTLVVHSSDKPVQEKVWVEASGMMLVMLAVYPPALCKNGKVQAHVTRRSCRKTAVVEFDLDPAAQGAGCYVA